MSTRRTSLTSSSRRRSGGAPRLGAVKLAQSPLAAGASDAGSPSCSSGPASALATPQEQSPLPAAARSAGVADSGHMAATAVAADVVAQFSQQLSASRSADRWLEERLTTGKGVGSKGEPCHQGLLPGAAQQQGSSSVESAASQIVHKALRFITAEPSPGGTAPKTAAAPKRPSSTFDSASFLDKGMDAISGVGRLMEGFAVTLDNVIGQAFGDWGSSSSSSTARMVARRPASASGSGAAPRQAAAAGAGAPGAAGKENAGGQAAAAGAAGKPRQQGSGRQPHIASLMSKLDAVSEQEAAEWRKRAQQLASELQRMRAQQEEYQRLRLQYEKLQTDLQQASSQASKLEQENCALKSRPLPLELVVDPALADPLAAQQVARQMEALLSEKSKLVAENDRLLRENTGLQELLEFTLAHQSQLAADGDLFEYDEDGCCDGLDELSLAGGDGKELTPAASSQSPRHLAAAGGAVAAGT